MSEVRGEGYRLIRGDCLEVLESVDSGSVDLILADPPYGKTKAGWDEIIPIGPMWDQLKRIMKDRGAVVLTCSQPFTTLLGSQNLKMLKESLIWEKTAATGHLNCKRRFMRAHEDILVFYSKPPTFNPQMTTGHKKRQYLRKLNKKKHSDLYGIQTDNTFYNSETRYPRSVIKTSTDKQRNNLHPTQKPMSLMRYLIRTYSNPGDLVVDFCMGSGTTGAAAIELDRRFVGIERDVDYFKAAAERIEAQTFQQQVLL